MPPPCSCITYALVQSCCMPHDACPQGASATPPPPPVKIAVGQMTAGSDQQANFQTCARLAQVGPVLVEIIPYIFDCRMPVHMRMQRLVEQVPSDASSFLMLLSSISCCFGSFGGAYRVAQNVALCA